MLHKTLKSCRTLHKHISYSHFIQTKSFSSLSKEERQRKLEEKYQPNTTLPKRIGHLSNIHKDQLVYIPPISQQLNPDFYTSHLSNQTDADLSDVCIYKYQKRILRGNNSSALKESLQLGLFASFALGFPAALMYSMYRDPHQVEMTGMLTHEGIFYWTTAGIMGFLVCGFFVALRQQTMSWSKSIKQRLHAQTSYISKISIQQPNVMNIEYMHNAFLFKQRLSHSIELSESDHNSNCCVYLRPSINAITQSPDVCKFVVPFVSSDYTK